MSDPRTYKCYGRVNRKDKPQTCKSGAEIRQWKLDGLVLTLSLQMFAQINIKETNENRIKKLKEEIANAEKILSDKQLQLSNLDSDFTIQMKRLSRMKGSSEKVVRSLMDEAEREYSNSSEILSSTIAKKQNEITSKKVIINRLINLSSNCSDIISKMDEIRNNKELVKSMIDEYVDSIIIYKIHPMWNLVIVKYNNEMEFWGTIKAARYRNEETFYDETLCKYGVEFQTWVINNSNHCFAYKKDYHTVTYNGKDDLYPFLPKGTYSFEELDQILHDTQWIGSYPFYSYENQSANLMQNQEESIPDFLKHNTDFPHIDWSKHNQEVLARLSKKKK